MPCERYPIMTKARQRAIHLANEAFHAWLVSHGATALDARNAQVTTKEGLTLLVNTCPHITRYAGLRKTPRHILYCLFCRFTDPIAAHAVGYTERECCPKWNHMESHELTPDEWLESCIERIGKRAMGVSWDEIDLALSIIDGSYPWPRYATEAPIFARVLATHRLAAKFTTTKLRRDIALIQHQVAACTVKGNDRAVESLNILADIRIAAINLKFSALDIEGNWITL